MHKHRHAHTGMHTHACTHTEARPLDLGYEDSPFTIQESLQRQRLSSPPRQRHEDSRLPNSMSWERGPVRDWGGRLANVDISRLHGAYGPRTETGLRASSAAWPCSGC